MLILLPTHISISPSHTIQTTTLLTPTTTFPELLHILLHKPTDFGIPLRLTNPHIHLLPSTSEPLPIHDDSTWEHARRHILSHPTAGLVMTATAATSPPTAGIPVKITGYTRTGKVDIATQVPVCAGVSYAGFVKTLEGIGRGVFPHADVVLSHVIVYDHSGRGTTIHCSLDFTGLSEVGKIGLVFRIEKEGVSGNTERVVEVMEELGLGVYDGSNLNGGVRVWGCGGVWGYDFLRGKMQWGDGWLSSADGTVSGSVERCGGTHYGGFGGVLERCLRCVDRYGYHGYYGHKHKHHHVHGFGHRSSK